MITETEIYRSAKLIIDQFGSGAIIEAAMRQDNLAAIGDLEGARVWSKIGDAIEWMQMPTALETEKPH